MAKRRRSTSRRRNPRTPRIDPQQVKECAMLLMSPEEAAGHIGITIENFEVILRETVYQRAWRDGRLAVRKSLHASLLTAAKDGKVPAIRMALEMADLDVPEANDEAGERRTDVRNDTSTPGILANFKDLMRGREERRA